jgi:hypothetical protein
VAYFYAFFLYIFLFPTPFPTSTEKITDCNTHSVDSTPNPDSAARDGQQGRWRLIVVSTLAHTGYTQKVMIKNDRRRVKAPRIHTQNMHTTLFFGTPAGIKRGVGDRSRDRTVDCPCIISTFTKCRSSFTEFFWKWPLLFCYAWGKSANLSFSIFFQTNFTESVFVN